jgi:glycosyltransferase involved in cell wall biosynthesis
MSANENADSSAPAVTVLMSVFNGQAHVGMAVRSILGQTFRDFELLVIDDGSTDDTAAIVNAFEDPRIRLIRNPRNIGLTRSLNRGLALARGAVVARQDADDVSHPARLQRQMVALDRRFNIALIGAQTRVIDSDGRLAGSSLFLHPTCARAITWHLMFDNAFAHSTTIFRRRIVWDTLGGYDESFRTNQDFELWSRVTERHDAANLPEVLVDFRVSDGQVSRRYSADGLARARTVMARNLARSLALPEFCDAWLDAWIPATNPRVFPDVPNAARIPALLRRFHRRFLELHPDVDRQGPEGEEIRQQVVTMLTRASVLTMARNAPASARLLAAAFSVAPLKAARTVGQYAAGWVVRRSVGAKRARSTADHRVPRRASP